MKILFNLFIFRKIKVVLVHHQTQSTAATPNNQLINMTYKASFTIQLLISWPKKEKKRKKLLIYARRAVWYSFYVQVLLSYVGEQNDKA